MITYFRMKYKEWKIKTKFYDLIIEYMRDQEEIFEFIKKIYLSLKDVPIEDLKNEFISEIIKAIHVTNN